MTFWTGWYNYIVLIILTSKDIDMGQPMKSLSFFIHACAAIYTLVNVYVDLVVFTRIAGTSYTGSGRYWS